MSSAMPCFNELSTGVVVPIAISGGPKRPRVFWVEWNIAVGRSPPPQFACLRPNEFSNAVLQRAQHWGGSADRDLRRAEKTESLLGRVEHRSWPFSASAVRLSKAE